MYGVMIIDDHRVFAGALASALANEADIDVAATAGSLAEARVALATATPDVIVIDGHIGEEGGIDLVAETTDGQQTSRVVVLVDHEDPALATAAVRAGALGVVAKTAPLETLITAIRHVAHGEGHLSASLLGAVLTRLREEDQQERAARRLFEDLTPRERDVLALMVQGLDRAAIARQLYTSVNTVRTHTQSLFRKLGVHSSIEAVSFARRLSWEAKQRPVSNGAG